MWTFLAAIAAPALRLVERLVNGPPPVKDDTVKRGADSWAETKKRIGK